MSHNLKYNIVTTLEGVRGAIYSQCDKYRYALWEIWDHSAPLWCMIMMNPSTATEFDDDPTVQRQIKRVRAQGAGGLLVLNVAGIRETNPDIAFQDSDPVGPANFHVIRWLTGAAQYVVLAYGERGNPYATDTLNAVHFMAFVDKITTNVCVLAVTKNGIPRHPLYLPYNIEPYALSSYELALLEAISGVGPCRGETIDAFAYAVNQSLERKDQPPCPIHP